MSDNQPQWWSTGASPEPGAPDDAWDRIVEPTQAPPTRRSRRDLRTPAPEPAPAQPSWQAPPRPAPQPAPAQPSWQAPPQPAPQAAPQPSWQAPPRPAPQPAPAQPSWQAPPRPAAQPAPAQPSWQAPPQAAAQPAPAQPSWQAPPQPAPQAAPQPTWQAPPRPAAQPVASQPPRQTMPLPAPQPVAPSPAGRAAAATATRPAAAARGERAARSGGDGGSGTQGRSGGNGRSGRRGGHRGRSILVLVVALAMVLGAGYVVYTLLGSGSAPGQVQDYPGPGHPSAQVVINHGDTGADMGRTLQAAGVVATQAAFVRAYAANPNAAKIQPGTYNLLLQMKASDAVTALLDPASKASLKVTIPEGLTAAQIEQKISEKTAIPLADLQAAAANPTAIGLPAQAGGKIEGWLFPATYEIDPKATAASVLTQMTKKTVDVLTAKGISADQWKSVLTEASLIEREVKLDSDRPKVARAIDNRMAKGMILQIDTSTAYGLNKSAMDLTKADLADSSNPYNLYQVAGLPPTPICSPGEASIDAVLSPADGNWLFWETINLDTGETVFSETKAEHDAAVKQFDAWAAAQKASATPTP